MSVHTTHTTHTTDALDTIPYRVHIQHYSSTVVLVEFDRKKLVRGKAILLTLALPPRGVAGQPTFGRSHDPHRTMVMLATTVQGSTKALDLTTDGSCTIFLHPPSANPAALPNTVAVLFITTCRTQLFSICIIPLNSWPWVCTSSSGMILLEIQSVVEVHTSFRICS